MSRFGLKFNFFKYPNFFFEKSCFSNLTFFLKNPVFGEIQQWQFFVVFTMEPKIIF